MASPEAAQAVEDIRKLTFAFTELGAVRCAIELGIPDRINNHPGGVTLTELSSELRCSPSSLRRLMRLLTHRRIFKQVEMNGQDSPIAYAPTAISNLITHVAPVLLMASSPEIVTSKFRLSKSLLSENGDVQAFEDANGADLWRYIEANPSFGEMFNKAMACLARATMSAMHENHMAAFAGIGSLVDVGGGDGTTLRAVVMACPWITRAINLDLPHVVSSSDGDGCIEHVGGDMFVGVPTADAAFMMQVLHDWDDDACLKILKNCKQAIPKETGKVIIVDIVMDDDHNLKEDNKNEFRDYQMAMDIEMMTNTIRGRERTAKEWANLLTSAGFTKYTITHIPAPQSVIEAYP